MNWLKEKISWKAIVGFLIGGATAVSIGANLGNVAPPAKVNVLGERAIYSFSCPEGEVREFSTAADYNERFIEPPKRKEIPDPPTKEGCVWKGANRATEFDTPDGFIHDGEYAETIENGEERVFIMLSGDRFYNFSKEDFLKIQSATLQ